jgi:hypothetical protein
MSSPGRLTLVLAATAALVTIEAAPRLKAAGAPGAAAQSRSSGAPEDTRTTRFITYSEARPILERLLPELAAIHAARPASERDAAWHDWASRRDADIRARLERGDEDSLINLLLFGTSYTKQPRALNDSSLLGGVDRAADLVRRRIDDLVSGIVDPGDNERLQFGRELIRRRGIDPAAASGREQTRLYLRSLMERASREVASYIRAIESVRAAGGPEMAARSTLYRARGLSSDTSIRSDFAIDRTLEALRAKGLLDSDSVRRVAVIGPGLDFTDKAEGYDFYPLQTTQPFALIDSLRRLGLAADDLTLTTVDLSPRVNGHLQAAQRRAMDGAAYPIVLPRERAARWAPDLLRFWKRAGSTVGDDVSRSMPTPPSDVEVRAIGVRADVVQSLRVRDINIVVERIDPLPETERFDVVIATNVLVYYDVVEQSLALANIASMLRPGGVLLSNNVLVELPTTPVRSIGHTDAIYSDRPDDRDQIVWYQRQ